jgi:carbamoyl-phosphate synthase large subunit
MYNILITGTGGCGVGEGLYKSLKPLEKYKVFSCNSGDNSLYLFDELNKSFIVPLANDENYSKIILEICKEYNIKTIIPGSEQELVVLVKNRDFFYKEGVVIYANTFDVINTFDNKWETFVRLNSLDIKTPDTTLDIHDRSFFDRNTYPLIIKPVYGNASKNVFIIDSEQELKCVSDYLKLKNIPYVIQEHVGSANEEYTISVLSDLSGEYLGSIVLKRVLAGGFSQFVECESFAELDEIAKQIALSIDSKGPLNIQCRMMNDELYVFEINPRFSGTSPFRTLFGFNEADVLFSKQNENINTFDKSKIQIGSFGVRGFQEKIYNNKVKSKVYKQ